MREQLKALSRETLIYGTSTVIGRFLNFLLVPFYVNVLKSTAEYGVATSLYTYIGFLNVIYPLGLEAAYFRYAAKAEGSAEDREEASTIFSTAFWTVAVFSFFLSLVIFIGAPAFVWPIFHDPKVDIGPWTGTLTQILRLGAGILFFDSLMVIPFAALRLAHRAKRFAALRLLHIVISLILNYVFILKLGWGVRGIFAANVVASVLIFVLLMPTALPYVRFRIAQPLLRKLLPFGLTNVPAYLSSMMVQVIDRPIVQNILGLGMLGVYQANYRMGFIMMVLVGLFEYAWRPFFLRQAATDDARARRIFSRVFTYFMALALFTFLGLTWGLPILLTTPIAGYTLLREPYWTGLSIIPVVLLAYVFQGAYTNFIAGIYIKERNKVLPFITGLGAGINITANLLLVPGFGLMGAAWATLMAYMAMAIALYREAQRVYPVAYEWRRIGKVVGVVAASYILDVVVGRLFAPSGGAAMAIKALLFVLAIVALFPLQFFLPSELQTLRRRAR